MGTGRTGLDISSHQLGFVPPEPTVVVRQSGENTTGYPEHAFSIINRYQFSEGRLRGTVIGLSTIYQMGLRGYMYTSAASGGVRKIYYYPDRFENRLFASYSFKLGRKVGASLQVNISNLFDRQNVVTRLRSTDGTVRYFSYQYAPRLIAITAGLNF